MFIYPEMIQPSVIKVFNYFQSPYTATVSLAHRHVVGAEKQRETRRVWREREERFFLSKRSTLKVARSYEAVDNRAHAWDSQNRIIAS